MGIESAAELRGEWFGMPMLPKMRIGGLLNALRSDSAPWRSGGSRLNCSDSDWTCTRRVRVQKQTGASSMCRSYEESTTSLCRMNLRRMSFVESVSTRIMVPPQHGQAHEDGSLPSGRAVAEGSSGVAFSS